MNINKWYGQPPDRRYNRHSLEFKSAVAAIPLKIGAYLGALEAYVDLAVNDSIYGDYPLARVAILAAAGFASGEFGERQLEAARLPEPEKPPTIPELPAIPDNIILGEN